MQAGPEQERASVFGDLKVFDSSFQVSLEGLILILHEVFQQHRKQKQQSVCRFLLSLAAKVSPVIHTGL